MANEFDNRLELVMISPEFTSATPVGRQVAPTLSNNPKASCTPMSPTDIVAYTFNADIYCPTCIIDILPTDDGKPFDGWAISPGADPMSTEENLDEIATAFGIDRYDETTFDSGDFPKVVFESMLDAAEYCGNCCEEIR